LPPGFAETAPELALFFAFESDGAKVGAIILSVLSAVLLWYLWSWALRAVGNLMTSKARRSISGEEMRRLVAWSDAPALAQFLWVIPALGTLLALLGSVWSIVAMVMAVRVAFDAGVAKAVAIVIAALAVVVVFLFALSVVAVLIAG
jgi:hypothetical protein